MIDGTIEHFRANGWMRVRGAFSADEAAAIRAAVWSALADVGIRREDPSTWTKERPEHLQHVKDDPAFQAIVAGSHRLVHKYFTDHPPPPGARGADDRKLLQGHPYLRDLHTAFPPQRRRRSAFDVGYMTFIELRARMR